MGHQKNFQHYRPISDILTTISILHCNYNGELGQKIDLVITFDWKGPIDLRPARLNCILQDFFRDTPLDDIWRIQIHAQTCIFGIFGHICKIETGVRMTFMGLKCWKLFWWLIQPMRTSGVSCIPKLRLLVFWDIVFYNAFHFFWHFFSRHVWRYKVVERRYNTGPFGVEKEMMAALHFSSCILSNFLAASSLAIYIHFIL